MVITLQNGVNIELKWSFLILQYLEDYEGGLKKLRSDMQQKKNLLKIQSLFLYAAVRANYDETVSFQEAVRLVKMQDIKKINQFFNQNFEEQEEFQKKRFNTTQQKKKKKK